MEEEKIPKQKPHTSFNRQLFVVKNPEGNMTTAKKNVKKFILWGDMTKGGIWQRVLRYLSCFCNLSCQLKNIEKYLSLDLFMLE